jgi:hypothetical protein
VDITVTLGALAAALILAVFAGWRGARPWNPAAGGVRMVPWRLVMVLAGAAVFVLLIHLGALLGAPTASMTPIL